MNTLRTAILLLALASGAAARSTPAAETAAQSAPAAETMGRVSKTADQQLASSVEELNKLRERIASEKLPLSQELSSLEEKLSQLRHENERMTREVDAGNLAISGIKLETKRLQDDLTYLGGFLDEYTRGFESKLNISELQYCGDAIEAAKQAFTSDTLSQSDKFARQTAFTALTIQRLFDALGGMRFKGVGVDLQGSVAKGEYAVLGPVALFRGEAGSATGLVVPQTGSTKPLIRPLDPALQAGIAALLDTGEGLLPLDPSRGGALKALVQRTNIIHIFEKGGPIMWPLLIASILALGTVIERLIFLARERMKRDSKAQEAFFAAVTEGEIEKAISISNNTRYHVVRALGYALTHREQSLANALVYAQSQEMKRFRRGIPILDTVITLAPLLGLLGTVTGMMGSFSLIGGDLSSPGAITGGIAEALIATAFGLGIAITALLPFNFLNTKLDEANHDLESATAQLELLVQRTEGKPMTVIPAPPPVDVTKEESVQHEREMRRKRDSLQKRIAELKAELEEQEMEYQMLPNRERGFRPENARRQPAKE